MGTTDQDLSTGSPDKLLERFSALLFLTQIVHLVWMSTYVIPIQMGSAPWWSPPETPLALADYLEIPAIISATLLYVRTKDWKMLLLVNVQLLHIFWITDEFVLERGILNPVLAWTAILIDYLELPVIYDTIKRSVKSFMGTAQPVES